MADLVIGSSMEVVEIEMPINAQIPLSVQSPQFENPLNALAKAMQIRQMQQQGDMSDLQMQQTKQGIERQNQLRQLLGGFTPEMKPEEQAAQLTRGGYLPEAQSVTKTAAEIAKAKAEGTKAQLENTLNKFKLGTQILSSVKDENSYQQAKQISAQQGFDPWPDQYNPAWVQQNLAIGVDYTKRLEDEARKRADETTRRGQDMVAKTAADKLNTDKKDAAKPPTGYRYKADGTLEPIPGGPADEKATSKAKKEELAANSTVDRAKLMTSTIDDALAKTGFFTTGLTGAAIGKIPGTKAYDLRGTIDTVKANIGFAELSAMRQASPTGGALGQVAVKELDMLQATLGNLDANQSESVVRKQLKAVKEHYDNWKEIMKKAGYEGSTAEKPATPATNIDALLEKYK